MSVTRDTTLIATVRRFVGELCMRVLDDPNVTSRVVVATHEMLDNAVRYASREGSQIRVTVQRVRDEANVVIDTTNGLDADRARDLQRVLDELRAGSDRPALYLSLIRRAARREGGSGLGLGRVYAESELDLSGRFEDDVVHLRAEGRFSLEEQRP
jgi:hypothetical protein